MLKNGSNEGFCELFKDNVDIKACSDDFFSGDECEIAIFLLDVEAVVEASQILVSTAFLCLS